MPKLKCLCGEVINLSPIPNPNGFMIIGEVRIESLIDRLLESHIHAKSPQDFERRAYDLMLIEEPEFPHMYECSGCGELAILKTASDRHTQFWYQQMEWEGGDRNFKSIRDLFDEDV